MPKQTENIDRSLVARLKEGDVQAFQKIFTAYSENLFHFTFSYLKDTFEAEEIVQEVFLRIWEIRAEIDEKKSFKSFIYKMAVNKVFNHIKHQVVRQKYESYLQYSNHTFKDNPEAKVHFDELEKEVNGLMSKLPEQQMRIFKLSRFDGLSNPQIADKLGLSIRTVENQVYRAVKFLKENLKHEYIFILFCLKCIF